METIQLRPTRGPERRFEGELLVHSVGDPDDKSTLGRCHDISIYRQSDAAQWAVCIEYKTQATSESPVTDVEVVDAAKDIELVLQMYQPNEYINPASMRNLYEEARKRIVKQLFLHYDRQVRDVLQQLSALGILPLETRTPTDVTQKA